MPILSSRESRRNAPSSSGQTTNEASGTLVSNQEVVRRHFAAMNALTEARAQGKLHISIAKSLLDWKLRDTFIALNAEWVVSITNDWLLAHMTNELKTFSNLDQAISDQGPDQLGEAGEIWNTYREAYVSKYNAIINVTA